VAFFKKHLTQQNNKKEMESQKQKQTIGYLTHRLYEALKKRNWLPYNIRMSNNFGNEIEIYFEIKGIDADLFKVIYKFTKIQNTKHTVYKPVAPKFVMCCRGDETRKLSMDVAANVGIYKLLLQNKRIAALLFANDTLYIRTLKNTAEKISSCVLTNEIDLIDNLPTTKPSTKALF
jgi:hypothetical protein